MDRVEVENRLLDKRRLSSDDLPSNLALLKVSTVYVSGLDKRTSSLVIISENRMSYQYKGE